MHSEATFTSYQSCRPFRDGECGIHVESVWNHFFRSAIQFLSLGVPDPESRPRARVRAAFCDMHSGGTSVMMELITDAGQC